METESFVEAVTSTIRFYEDHAQEYFDRTIGADLSHLYAPFLMHIPPGGRILDAGCGSGRDLKVFRQRGFDPVGIDAAPTLAILAEQVSGVPCYRMSLEQMTFDRAFDGIWACASLLHIPRGQLGRALGGMNRALRAKGTLFASVQAGIGERFAADGRFFSYYKPDEFAQHLEAAQFVVRRTWTTKDALSDRPVEWINVIAGT